jgi:hypothetical protein
MYSETHPVGPESVPLDEVELRAQYRGYRRRQARGLVRMLPRDAVRPLYRRALRGRVSDDPDADPLESLVAFCEEVLPLPPFDVWREDLARHPNAHLRDLDESAETPTVDAPATMEARTLDVNGHPWIAQLRSFRDGVAWRGFIAFQDAHSRVVHRTAVIFREWTAAELRESFLSFEPAALVAFLRSALG